MSSPSQPLLVPAVPVDVRVGKTTVVTVDLSRVLGVIEGGMTLNGAAAGSGFSLLVERGKENAEEFIWLMDLPPSGQFRLLLPSGAGRGIICSSELVSNGHLVDSTTLARGIATGLLAQPFTFNVQAGKTILVSPAIGP